MTLIGMNLEFRFPATGFLNRGNHAFRSFRGNNFVLASGESMDRNFGQICRPFIQIRRHIFRPTRSDAT